MGEFRIPVNRSGYATIPKYLRERYLTPNAESAVVHPIGTHLQIVAPSERKDLLLRLELIVWVEEGPRERSMAYGGVHVERWIDALRLEHDGDKRYAVASDQEVNYEP